MPLSLNKPVSTDIFNLTNFNNILTEIENEVVAVVDKGVANGVATLGSDIKVPIAQLPDGTTSAKGILQLNNTTNSTSTTQAATPNAVKLAYDLANSKLDASQKGVANGIASLDATLKIPIAQLPSATQTNAGTMSSSDKTKLDGVSANANNYSHPTGDGNLHVIATGTTNNGKVLKAGATAGSLSWSSISFSELLSKPTTLAGYGITDASSSTHNHDGTYLKVTGGSLSSDLILNNDTNLKGKKTDGTILSLAYISPTNNTIFGQSSNPTQLNGSTLKYFNGTTSYEILTTNTGYIKSEIDTALATKSPTSHNHDTSYLKLSGGDVTGYTSFKGLGVSSGYFEINTYNTTTYGTGKAQLFYNGVDNVLKVQGRDGSNVAIIPKLYVGSYEVHTTDTAYSKSEVDTSLATKSDTSHNHDASYLKLTGGNLSGNLDLNNTISLKGKTVGGVSKLLAYISSGDVASFGDTTLPLTLQGTSVKYSNGTNTYDIYHSGNLTPSNYSLTSHNHNSAYATLSHNHDTIYQKKLDGDLITNFGGDFNSVLTQGEYKVGGTNLTNAPLDSFELYGKLVVTVSDGGTHNNLDNWIWQTLLLTADETWTRYKVNNSTWGAWTKNVIEKGGNVKVSNGFVSESTVANVELGSKTQVSTPFIDFHTSGTNIDYDTRIIAGVDGLSIIGARDNLALNSGQLVVGGYRVYIQASAPTIAIPGDIWFDI